MSIKEDLYLETRKKYSLVDKSNAVGNHIWEKRREKLKLDMEIAKIDKKIQAYIEKDGIKVEKLKNKQNKEEK